MNTLLCEEVHEVVLPWPPFPQEFVAYRLLVRHFAAKISGDEPAMRFIERQELLDYQRTGEEAEKSGKIFIGFGNGRFDPKKNGINPIVEVVSVFAGAQAEQEADFYLRFINDKEFLRYYEENVSSVSQREVKHQYEAFRRMVHFFDVLYDAAVVKKQGWISKVSSTDSNFYVMKLLGFIGDMNDMITDSTKQITNNPVIQATDFHETHPYIKGVITHENLDYDEIRALWILKRFGHVRFRGTEMITQSEMIFDRSVAAQHSHEEWLEKGYLLLGVGGGPFDEHPHHGRGVMFGENCTTLLARFLGVDQSPLLSGLVSNTENSARYLNAHLKDLSRQMTRNGMQPRYIIEMIHAILDQYMLDQKRIHGYALPFIDTMKELEISNGVHRITVGVLTSKQGDAFAHLAFKVKPNVSIIIDESSDTGHISVLFREDATWRGQNEKRKIREFLQMVRVKECQKQGRKIPDFVE